MRDGLYCGNDAINGYDYLGYSWFPNLWNKVRHVVVSNVIRIVGNIIVPGLGEVLSAAYDIGVGAKYGGVKGALLAAFTPRIGIGENSSFIINPGTVGAGRSGGGGGGSGGYGPGGVRSPLVMNFSEGAWQTASDAALAAQQGARDYIDIFLHVNIGIISGVAESNGITPLPPASRANQVGKSRYQSS